MTTRWSQVLLAGKSTLPDGDKALEKLCRVYWPPLYARARRDGHSPEDAQDLVQGFIAHLLDRNDFAKVSPERGRFRSFLLSALKNYIITQARAAGAKKRGGGQLAVSIDVESAEELCGPELADTLSPDRAFDRHWARTVMARALERLRDEHRSPQQQKVFAALEPSLAEGGRVRDHAQLAAGLGVTPAALAVAATRLRQRYRAAIEAEIAETLSDPADMEEEMRALRDAWKK